MIDKDKIFKLFVDGKEIDGDKTKEEIKDFMNGPYAKIGMFVKLIQNHEVFHKKLEKFLKQEQPDYNVESTKEASEFTVYNRAWSYIKQIDIDNSDHLNAIINFDPKVFYKTLEGAVNFFESYEEYEKCAHLHKIKELVKEI
jgi:hypothetical protein|tara:strand:- start:760 stop:1185 length:426 start_codon:yes stop_codon:yes gene_type:complete